MLNHWLGEPKRKLTERGVKLIYRYQSIDNVTAKLKIEINTTEHFHVEPLQTYSFAMQSEWYQGSTSIVSYTLDELMATKLRALYQRRKGRDLFDLWYVLNHGLVNTEKVLSIFEQYCQYNKELITRAMFEKSLFLKKQQHDFQSDILALLVPGTPWDFSLSMRAIESHLIQKLKGRPWQEESNS